MKLIDLIDYFESQRENFIDLLKTLVSFQTFSGEKRNINFFIDYLKNLFSGFNPKITRIETEKGDILYLSLFSEIKDFLVLLAHVDTVKTGESPVPVRTEGGRFYGNGCFDMKSAIALFYFSIKAIRKYKLKCDKQIKLIFTPDEEIGSNESMPFLLEECQEARAVILPESCCPDGGVKIKRKGIVLVKAKLKGKASHSGIEPERGNDANRALVKLITVIEKIIEKYPEVTFNPGIISGGVGINVVSPESILEGEFRSYSNIFLKKVANEMNSIKSVRGVEVEMSAKIKHPALEFNKENKKLYEMAKKIACTLKYNLFSCSSGGASDGSTLSSKGIPVIDGIGIRGGNSHSIDEYIELSDFPFRAALITGLYQEI